jgi:hypothetical protein
MQIDESKAHAHAVRAGGVNGGIPVVVVPSTVGNARAKAQAHTVSERVPAASLSFPAGLKTLSLCMRLLKAHPSIGDARRRLWRKMHLDCPKGKRKLNTSSTILPLWNLVRTRLGGVWDWSFFTVLEEYCSILKYCSIIYRMVFGKPAKNSVFKTEVLQIL